MSGKKKSKADGRVDNATAFVSKKEVSRWQRGRPCSVSFARSLRLLHDHTVLVGMCVHVRTIMVSDSPAHLFLNEITTVFHKKAVRQRIAKRLRPHLVRGFGAMVNAQAPGPLHTVMQRFASVIALVRRHKRSAPIVRFVHRLWWLCREVTSCIEWP